MSDDSIVELVQPHLRSAAPYVPVQPPEALAQRLGVPVERIIKVDANENPFGPSPKAIEALANCTSYHIYPDPEQRRVREVLGRYVGYGPEWIACGSGSDEMIELCVRLLVAPGEAILNFPPTFGMYTFLAGVLLGSQSVVNVPRQLDYSLDLPKALEATKGTKLIFAVTPNNPTGTLITRPELDALLGTGLPVVVDEAYAEFAGESYASLVREHENLIVLRTLSKWAGLAGVRVGYMIAQPSLIDIIMKVKQPYTVSIPAEVATLASFEDLPLLQERVSLLVAERGRLMALLSTLPGVEITPSRANFVLCRLNNLAANDVQARLQDKGIMVRYFDTPLLQNHLRISVGLPEQNDAVVQALRGVIYAMSQPATGAPR
jgi:histidinol-phosphate aminotransferase